MGIEVIKEKLAFIRLLISGLFVGLIGALIAAYQAGIGSLTSYFLIGVAIVLLFYISLCYQRLYKKTFNELVKLEEKEKSESK